MTTLAIMANYEKKRLKCFGNVAAGEHVAVTVVGGAQWIGQDKALRLRVYFGPNLVGVFPPQVGEGEVAPQWEPTGEGDADAECELNLNTLQAEKYMRIGESFTCLWILDDVENHTLYATGEYDVLPWPKRRGIDEPIDLDGYPDLVADMGELQTAWEEYKQNMAVALRSKQDVINDLPAIRSGATAGASAVQPAALLAYVNGGTYDSSAKKIYLKHDDSVIAEIDATDFIKDGMVDDVKVTGGNLVITFNTAAGKDPISIPLTDIFNPDAYYDKTAADARFATKADATLTERGPNHDGFSAWIFTPSEFDGDTIKMKYEYGGWQPYTDSYGNLGRRKGDAESTMLTWVEGVDFAIGFTATRTALQGYQLGLQADKPLASEAEAEALRAGKANLSNGKVPTSELPDGTTNGKGIVQLDTALTASGKAADAKATGDALEPLQLAALYPEGDVKSASEWATPWDGSTGIKYELDTATHTAAILTFSKTTNTANDNSHLTGRVVIPPFIESNGERYIVASIKDHSTGGLPTYDLTEVVAPTTLETIGRFAFCFCMGLKRAYFPRASQLKYNAFQDCRALEYISIPNVSNVPTQCFINDSSLKGLTIPNAESILLGGLSGCAALEVVNFGSVARSAVPTFYNNSFYNVPVTCKIIIPDSQYTAWTTASGWSGLVTAGYQFLKHSEWEYARRYELAAKQDTLSQTQLANIAAVSDALAFDATYLYAAGDPVVYNGTLYTFTATHTGAWTGSDVSAVDIIARLADKLDKSGGEMTPTFISGVIPPGKVVFGTDAAGPYIGIAHGQNTVLLRPSQIEFDGRSAALAASPATAGNLAALDANGNPTDAGWTADNLARYALSTKTIDNGAVTLDDRAMNAVAVSSALASLTINFPTATSGKVRDFGLRLSVASGVTTAPELVLPQGITFENADGEVPEIGADGAATILYFTETASGVFLVKGEVVTAIS